MFGNFKIRLRPETGVFVIFRNVELFPEKLPPIFTYVKSNC
nr:MAG TPA: hypothetical protein [Caudoviricetes sp.]